MTTAKIGKIKKRYIFKPSREVATIFFSKNKRKLIVTFFIVLLCIAGANDVYMQIQSNFKNFYVFADTVDKSNSLNIDSESTIIKGNKDSVDTNAIQNTAEVKIEANVVTVDKRAYVFDQYFLKNKSPLYGTGKIFVEKCDGYGAPKDCIIGIAIARNETDLCKYNISAQMHNCWGFGGAGPNRIRFDNFDAAIDRLTRSLVFSYGEKYIINPSLMERTFCGSEPGCTNWGNKIKQFINEIDEYSKSIGMGSLLDLRK